MRRLQEDGSVWHEGELSVQRQAGVLQEARRMQDGIHSTIPDPFRRFIAAQRFAVLGTLDPDQRVWAWLLSGEPGFIQCPDRFSARIDAASVGDLVRTNIQANPDMGMVVMDFANRRRIRLNGEGENLPDGALLLHAQQAYSNCPRYIQQRVLVPGSLPKRSDTATPARAEASRLSMEQQRLIRAADTFFVATAHPEFGVDVSHRGGNPGFVQVESGRLLWPDYNGNKMFNTLGNIAVNPQVGLLFPDFATGAVLQLTGRATIDWDSAGFAQLPGAERLIVFDIDATVETADQELQRYRLESYSHYNPA